LSLQKEAVTAVPEEGEGSVSDWEFKYVELKQEMESAKVREAFAGHEATALKEATDRKEEEVKAMAAKLEAAEASLKASKAAEKKAKLEANLLQTNQGSSEDSRKAAELALKNAEERLTAMEEGMKKRKESAKSLESKHKASEAKAKNLEAKLKKAEATVLEESKKSAAELEAAGLALRKKEVVMKKKVDEVKAQVVFAAQVEANFKEEVSAGKISISKLEMELKKAQQVVGTATSTEIELARAEGRASLEELTLTKPN